MPLFILGAIVIVCCVVYIIAVDHPELFTGERPKAKKSRGFDYGGGEEEPASAEKDEPKVIYLPQSPEDIEAEKARRSKKKK